MKTSDVLVTVPTRGSVRWETVTALEAARDYDGFPPIVYQPGNLSVALTRNRIVDRFLHSDLPVLAMVDDDIAPPINFVEMLLPHLEDFAMVALPHPMPHPAEPSQMCLSAFEMTGEGFRPKGLWTGINQCDAVATGCVLIRRDTFLHLGGAPFRMATDPAEEIQSDDLLFCRDLHVAGLKVGAYWEGRAIDHFTTVSLEPIAAAHVASNIRTEILKGVVG